VKLGFVSAILPELSLDEVMIFAAETGYECVEVMCWPPGKAERRYAGITHIDVTALDPDHITKTMAATGVSISSLGYYPNALSANAEEAGVATSHIKDVISASNDLGIGVMTTFIGRDQFSSVEDNWPRFIETWGPLLDHAHSRKVKIGIENCPMLFSADEWPGGKNLATTPAIWRRMFAEFPAAHFGLNYDPSHLVWQMMDPIQPLFEFRDRIHHAHAKDCRVDRHRLDQAGIMAAPLDFHIPKLPGLGEVNWGRFFSVLSDVGYRGPVCVEVEDRAYEHSLEARKDALRQSLRYLKQFVSSR
jgi:sugar phosphate isomerase/epimerase